MAMRMTYCVTVVGLTCFYCRPPDQVNLALNLDRNMGYNGRDVLARLCCPTQRHDGVLTTEEYAKKRQEIIDSI
jgi:hypothetical protein